MPEGLVGLGIGIYGLRVEEFRNLGSRNVTFRVSGSAQDLGFRGRGRVVEWFDSLGSEYCFRFDDLWKFNIIWNSTAWLMQRVTWATKLGLQCKGLLHQRSARYKNSPLLRKGMFRRFGSLGVCIGRMEAAFYGRMYLLLSL